MASFSITKLAIQSKVRQLNISENIPQQIALVMTVTNERYYHRIKHHWTITLEPKQ